MYKLTEWHLHLQLHLLKEDYSLSRGLRITPDPHKDKSGWQFAIIRIYSNGYKSILMDMKKWSGTKYVILKYTRLELFLVQMMYSRQVNDALFLLQFVYMYYYLSTVYFRPLYFINRKCSKSFPSCWVNNCTVS